MSLLSNYRILHKGCDGQVTKRTCSKCRRQWQLFESWFTFDWYHQKIGKQKLTVLSSNKPEKSPRRLTGNILADTLPNWPRWARITSTLGILLVVVGVIIYVV